MSNREKCIALLNSFTENQLANIANLLQAAHDAIAEAEDDTFCSRLYEEYLSDTDKGEAISLEDAAKQLGVTL